MSATDQAQPHARRIGPWFLKILSRIPWVRTITGRESELLRHYLWKYRRLVGLGLLSLVIVDVLEVLPPIFLKEAVDVVSESRATDYFLKLAGAYLLVSFLQGLCRYGWRMFLIRSSMFAGRDLREKYATHLFKMPASFFDKRRIGDLMSLATNDVEAVRMAMGAGLLTLADALFYFITVPIAMFWLSPKLTLLAFLPLPIVPWLVARNEREIHSRFEKVQESFGKISAMAQEGLGGVRVIKSFATEDRSLGRFRAAGEEFIRLNMRLARVQTAFGPTLDFTMSLGLVLLLFVGGESVIGNAVTLGTFVAFQRYIQKMVWPMAALGMAFSYYQRALASSRRLNEVLDLSTDVPETEAPQLPVVAESSAPQGRFKTSGGIELRGLSFRFPGTQAEVLREISLTIEPGERIAVVGAIGSGKSALLSLFPRLYPVERGMLLIDGIDVNHWKLSELRRQVGFVAQDVFLFSETITENVAYGIQDWVERSAQPVTIEEATQLASIHEDVLGLKGAYETRLGERGVNLSGGQKQRITIARAIAKQPPILILDDALSSVDVATEETILKNLRSRPGRNTEVIAAHRISTVKDADRILVLDQGEIRQQGTHQVLMGDRRGAYRRYYDQQRKREDFESFVENYGGSHGEEKRP